MKTVNSEQEVIAQVEVRDRRWEAVRYFCRLILIVLVLHLTSDVAYRIYMGWWTLERLRMRP